jgi:hypothetical protein
MAGETRGEVMLPDEAVKYEIRTIEDFQRIPPEKLTHCLEDFGLWLAIVADLRQKFTDMEGVTMDSTRFVWSDDDRHDALVQMRVIGDCTSAKEQV